MLPGLRREVEEEIGCAQLTGIPESGMYRRVARERGYPFLRVVKEVNREGKGLFVVSRDTIVWEVMRQEVRNGSIVYTIGR